MNSNLEQIKAFNKNNISVIYFEEHSGGYENINASLDLETRIVTLSKDFSRPLQYVCYSSYIKYISPVNGETFEAAVDINPNLSRSRISKLVDSDEKDFLNEIMQVQKVKESILINEQLEKAINQDKEVEYQKKITDMISKYSKLPVSYVSNFNKGKPHVSDCTLNIFTGSLDLSQVKPITIDSNTEVISTKIHFKFFEKDVTIEATVDHWGNPKIHEAEQIKIYNTFEQELTKISFNQTEDTQQIFKI